MLHTSWLLFCATAFAISFLLTVGFMRPLLKICRRKGLYDLPSERKIHANHIPRLGGVLFIPPHLVVEVVAAGAKTQVKDMFGFKMISENKFTTAQIDKNTWTEEMLDLLMEYIRTAPEAEAYRDIDWSKEYDLARNGDPNDTQSAL